jgi:hypothetical protein
MLVKGEQLQNKKKIYMQFKINKEENIYAHQRNRKNVIES